MEEIRGVTEVAQGIGDLGMMAITAAFFLVLAGGLMIACFKWFKSIINNILTDNKEQMDELLKESKIQNDRLSDIAEGLRPETQLRVKNTANVFFDLATEKVSHLVKKIKEENHIANHESTKEKIRSLLLNIHEDRNSRFDCYTYRGLKLSNYTNPDWVNWVAEIVEKEVYSESDNANRTYTNVSSVYERIKLDFYHRIKQ